MEEEIIDITRLLGVWLLSEADDDHIRSLSSQGGGEGFSIRFRFRVRLSEEALEDTLARSTLAVRLLILQVAEAWEGASKTQPSSYVTVLPCGA